MQVSFQAIKAVAKNYTEEQIKAKLMEALEKLAEEDKVMSVNTGGASYSKQSRISVSEQIYLYQSALDLVQKGYLESPAQMARVAFSNVNF